MKWRSLFGSKPWDKQPCTFVLEEYGAAGEKGWAQITEPTGQPPDKGQCQEMFKPGRHYRVMAKSAEDGKFQGTVWKHYEPLPGGVVPKKPEPKEPREPKEREPASPAEVMSAYVESVKEVLEPLAGLNEAMKGIRDMFQPESGGNPGAVYPPQQMPPLEFSGKAPWVMHPYVVGYIGETVKDVLDHAFDRAKEFQQEEGEGEKKEGKAEEEKEPKLPRPEDFAGEKAELEAESKPRLRRSKSEREREKAPVEPPEKLSEERVADLAESYFKEGVEPEGEGEA